MVLVSKTIVYNPNRCLARGHRTEGVVGKLQSSVLVDKLVVFSPPPFLPPCRHLLRHALHK